VIGFWKRLNNEELRNLYSLFAKHNRSKVEENEMGRACRANGKTNAYRLPMGKPEGKRSLGIRRCRWVDIKIDLRVTGCRGKDRIDLAQCRDQWRALVNPRLS
jgi:hypothetical protein